MNRQLTGPLKASRLYLMTYLELWGYLEGDDTFLDLRQLRQPLPRAYLSPWFQVGVPMILPDGEHRVNVVQFLPPFGLGKMPDIMRAGDKDGHPISAQEVFGYRYQFSPLFDGSKVRPEPSSKK